MLNKTEKIIYILSISLIILSFLIFDRSNYFSLIASLIGATSLIFCAKGNYLEQILIIIFSLMYSIISYKNNYYGEMFTYLLMTMPMAIYSLINWFKHTKDSKLEIYKVNKLDILVGIILSIIVTIIFYFILKYFKTPNLLVSTLSIFTSFLAMYMMQKRSKLYSVMYALNDIVLIILWSLMIKNDISNINVVMCFLVFLLNDIYGFINWTKLEKK